MAGGCAALPGESQRWWVPASWTRWTRWQSLRKIDETHRERLVSSGWDS